MKKAKFRELQKQRKKEEKKAKKQLQKENKNVKSTTADVKTADIKEDSTASNNNLEETKPLFGAKGILKDIFKNN